MKTNSLLLVLLGACALSAAANAQRSEGRQRRGGAVGPVEVHEAPASAGIAWFGTWEGALAEAERTKRPILFMSAAPQCRNVPGVW